MQTPLLRFIADLLYNKLSQIRSCTSISQQVVQQIEVMGFGLILFVLLFLSLQSSRQTKRCSSRTEAALLGRLTHCSNNNYKI